MFFHYFITIQVIEIKIIITLIIVYYFIIVNNDYYFITNFNSKQQHRDTCNMY